MTRLLRAVSVTPAVALLAISFARAASVPWAGSVSQIPSLTTQNQTTAAIAPDGGFVMAASALPATCPSPTFTYGDSQSSSSCVTKYTASGQPVFSVQIGGAQIDAVTLDSVGNVLVAGQAEPLPGDFATTPGSYISSPPGDQNPVVCKLSGSDGHAIFCTFTDVYGGGTGVDAAGNVYLTGMLNNSTSPGIERLNPTGTGVVYEEAVPNEFTGLPDASGNLYVVGTDLDEFNPSGTLVASVSLQNEDVGALLVDASGNPEIVISDSANPLLGRVRKYAAGLTSVVFDTAVLGSRFIAEDSSGNTVLFGTTDLIDLPQVNPAGSCVFPAADEPAQNAYLVRVDNAGNIVQSTYVIEPFGTPGAMGSTATGAVVLFWGEAGTPVEELSFAPTTQTFGMGCVGNSASFLLGPVAPNEIVSVYGSGVGPSEPITAVPEANGFYPFEAGGTQVTFDGIAAPLLYVSSAQLNLVAPGAIAGKTSTQVCVLVNRVSTNCITAPVSASAVGVFGSGTFAGPGVPYAAALNQDGTVNSQENPAVSGSVMAIFVTGLGTVSPAVGDGGITPVPIPAPTLEVSADYYAFPSRISPQIEPLMVLYAGPAPLEVEGLGQVNFVVPSAPSGPASAVSIQVFASMPDGLGNSGAGAAIWVKPAGQ